MHDQVLMRVGNGFADALEQAQATKEKDQAQLAMAQADLARWSDLVASGYKSRQIDRSRVICSFPTAPAPSPQC